MDPWLEDPNVFPDFHDAMIVYLKEALNATLPPGYFAASTTIVWVDDQQRSQPDVSVIARHGVTVRPGVATLEALPRLQPLGIRYTPEPVEEKYLEIRSRGGERIVTAVEILSRSNKAAGSAGRKAYLDKQQEFCLGGVNMVEIDLLRAGTHTTAVPRSRLTRLHDGRIHYHVCVTEAGEVDRLFGAVFPLERPLPEIEIPLEPGLPRIPIALQPMLDRAYDAGRYWMRTDYAQPPTPPLSPEEQAWADGILRARTAPDAEGR
jgi:hypothetical protein